MEKNAYLPLFKIRVIQHLCIGLFAILLLVRCTAVPKEYLHTDELCKYDDPIFKVTKKEMTFDVDKYYNSETKNQGTIVIKDNAVFNQEFFKWVDGEVTNKQTNRHR